MKQTEPTLAVGQQILRLYISTHCYGCQRAVQLMDTVRRQRPTLRLEVVDVDAPDAQVPAGVIGTPIYMWNDQVLFLGNPSEAELLERIDDSSD